MHEHYRWADVLLLPSVCEGSAMVSYEALSAGLPVLTTPNAGSLVRHGLDGFVLAHDEVDGFVSALTHLASHPDAWVEMSRNAQLRALEGSAERYGMRLRQA